MPVGGRNPRGASGPSGADVRVADGGFTLVELVVAVLILAIGLLGLAGTTGFVVRQTALAAVTTERSVARQTVIESIRAQSYTSVGSGTMDMGTIETSWSVVADDGEIMTLRVITSGPGLGTRGGVPALVDQVADTFFFQRLNH